MVTDTSIDAYNDIQPQLGKRQARVFELIKNMVNPTNLEISELSGIPINQITPRTNELRKKGVVVEGGKRECTISGRTVMSWRIKK